MGYRGSSSADLEAHERFLQRAIIGHGDVTVPGTRKLEGLFNVEAVYQFWKKPKSLALGMFVVNLPIFLCRKGGPLICTGVIIAWLSRHLACSEIFRPL